jgi:hypothetical protein
VLPLKSDADCPAFLEVQSNIFLEIPLAYLHALAPHGI